MKKLFLLLSISLSTIVGFHPYQANAQITILTDFTGTANPIHPSGSLITDGAFLYGMAGYGGTNNMGTLFKIKTDGTGYLQLLNFVGAANGMYPTGSLISDGTYLYGMTRFGGTLGNGTIFKIMPDGSGYIKLYDFAGGGNGNDPHGSLFFDGTFLYGMTCYGGLNGEGTVFKIMPDGTGYVQLFDFAGVNGRNPSGSLISDGTFLYGMTYGGGTNDSGVVFKIMPDGTGYVKLLDFMGMANGGVPWGSLFFDGTFLYGMTYRGGTYDQGTLFKILPDGTGYVKLYDFTSSPNGGEPTSSVISDGTFLYGMTYNGGVNFMGTLFKILPDGTGYVKLLDFAGANGSHPMGSLISDGTFFYGMTELGGTANVGTVFKYCINVNCVTGINEWSMENQPLIIYPNPNSGQFTITTKEKQSEINIINTLGEIIFTSTINQQTSTIDISYQPSGIYFLQLKSANGIEMRKVIKQ